MLHFPSPIPNNMIRRPQRSDSLQAVGLGLSQQDNATLAILPDELHDMRRVQAYGQEEDLKEALGKMIGRVEELVSLDLFRSTPTLMIYSITVCNARSGSEDADGT